jgi:hypothetical protein
MVCAVCMSIKVLKYTLSRKYTLLCTCGIHGSVYCLIPFSLSGSNVTLLDFARACFRARSMLHRHASFASLLFACSCLTPAKIRADVCGKPSKDSWEGECLKSAVRFGDAAIPDSPFCTRLLLRRDTYTAGGRLGRAEGRGFVRS